VIFVGGGAQGGEPAGEKPELRPATAEPLRPVGAAGAGGCSTPAPAWWQCNWQRKQGKNGFAWDTHWNNFTAHKEDLVPPFRPGVRRPDDRPRAGRAARRDAGRGRRGVRPVAEITRSNAGREHWPECTPVLFAGGGIKGGVVHGMSDRHAAYPASNPTTPTG